MIVSPVDIFKDQVYFELYDVARDKQEQVNLAFDEQDVVRGMIDTLRGVMQDTSDEVHFVVQDYDRFLHSYARCRIEV